MKKQLGISLIPLIIIIGIILIIASVALVMLNDDGIIEQTNIAKTKEEFVSYKESLSLTILSSYIDNTNGSNGNITGKLSEYIPEINEEYENNLFIYDNKVVFIGETTDSIKQILKDVDIEYYENMNNFDNEYVENAYQIFSKNEDAGFNTKNPPAEGEKWESDNVVFNVGKNTSYNEETQSFTQTAGVGTAYYIFTDPFIIDYDKSFTIEYSFKMNNLERIGTGDVQMMSIQGVNPSFEHILFYTYGYSSQKQFSMYSQLNGMLNNVRNIEIGNTPSPLTLDNDVITLGLVYDKEEGLVKQFVNGVLHKEDPIQGSLSGETWVTWANTRQLGTSQYGIDGEVYKFAFYEERVSDEQLLINHKYYDMTFGE